MIRGRWMIAGLLALGLVAVAWAVLARHGRSSVAPEDLRSRLIEEVGPVRLLKGRLSGFEYAPEGTRSSVRSGELLRIVRKIEKRATRDPSPEALGAFALVKLLGENDPAASLRSGIDLLEQATAQPGAGARLWSDLAAVYLESADRGAAWNYPRALEAALRAARIDGELPEVRFNLALTLEENLLRADAWKGWAEYRDLKSDRQWRAEAYAHQHRLEQPSRIEVWSRRRSVLSLAALKGDRTTVDRIVREFPFRARLYAEEELLPGWAQALMAKRIGEAENSLRIVRAIGAALSVSWGEHMVEDSIAVIDRRSRAPNSEASLAALAKAYQTYIAGSGLCSENQGIRGSALLEEARSGFQKAGSPAVGWADYYLAVCSYQQNNYREAVERAERLLAEPGNGRYPSLVGRAHWILGLSLLLLAEPGAMLRSYSSALKVFERTGARPEIGGLCNLLGEAYVYLGERREAWRFFHRARAIVIDEGDLRRRYATTDQVADLAAREGFLQAALRFRNEVVRLALSQRDPPGQTHAFLRRAETWFELGQSARTRRDLELARRCWARIEDERERRRREPDLLETEGRLLAMERSAAALAPLGRALEIYRADDNRYALVGAYLEQAKGLIRAGRTAEAEPDLRAGIREFERQRGQVRNEELRIAYFEQARELFDLLIGLQADRAGGESDAFETAERQRARVLLDRLASGRRAEPLPLPEIRRRLPPGVALVVYASLPDRLLVWIVRRDEEPKLISLPLPERALAQLVSHLWVDLEGRASESRARERLSALSRAIFDPVRPSLRPGDRLVFVPDKNLNAIPFAALRSATGRYLMEDHASGVMPSASLAVRTSVAPAGKMDVLVVADPDFDSGRFGDLSRLSGARAEGVAIGALFGADATVLSGSAATREAFEREAGRRAIVHLGAHALLNPGHPYLSQLLLAPAGPEDPGTLNATQIQDLSLPRTRLVSLAGCRTGAGKLSSEGVLSLGRAFLAAGVPVVLTSLRDLNDEAAAELSTSFFLRLRQGDDPAEALRQTQLEAVRNGTEVSAWASLQILGGI